MSTTSPILITTRCSHRTPSGRRCPKLAADSKSGLCPRHLDVQKQGDVADLSNLILADWKDFQTAQGINFTLGSLYRALAANRISPRRAAVLAYISSLMLRTHPAIDSDRENGIDVPAAPTDAPPPTNDPSRHILGEQAATHALAPAFPDLPPAPEPDESVGSKRAS